MVRRHIVRYVVALEVPGKRSQYWTGLTFDSKRMNAQKYGTRSQGNEVLKDFRENAQGLANQLHVRKVVL